MDDEKTVAPAATMFMHDVVSSQFDKVGYDPATKKMRIQFKRNAVYEYDDVPQEAFDKLMAAESKGSHFINEIKKPALFKYRRIPSDGETQVT